MALRHHLGRFSLNYPRNLTPGIDVDHPRLHAKWVGTFPTTITDVRFRRVRAQGHRAWEVLFDALAHDGGKGILLEVPPDYVWSGHLERMSQLQQCVGHQIRVNVWRRPDSGSYVTTLDGDSDKVRFYGD